MHTNGHTRALALLLFHHHVLCCDLVQITLKTFIFSSVIVEIPAVQALPRHDCLKYLRYVGDSEVGVR
jgi:hypothetical protein